MVTFAEIQPTIMPAQAIASQVSYIPVKETGYFSRLVNDYVNENQDLHSFYDFEINDAGLKKAIDTRKHFPVDRELLHTVISEQYAGLEISPAVKANLELLRAENTFTVCSAHQPNLMTGYLYFIYKIIHSVKLAAHLKSLDAAANFVPVFYIGSEDNDFEELGHFRFAGKVFEWHTDQTGAVGMMRVDEPLERLIKALLPVLGPAGTSEKYLRNTILSAYKKGNSIAMATRILINDLLGFLGVLVLDANDARLKRKFVAVIKEEVLRPEAFELVKQDSERLNATYKAQAFFRPINFFYLKEGLRERIEYINNEYLVLNTELKFSAAEMEAEIEAHPERFSPNVILRGLYQESILPD
ncbi:MAG: bacillithiol biosynthesis BshC, partial [Sphingobacteriales bacterium]